MKKILLFLSLFAVGIMICNAQSSIVWKAAANISASSYGNMHPRIVIDGKGNPLVIWGKMSDASVYFARWTGAAFSTPVKVNPSWLSIATATWMGPDLASKGDTIYIVVKRTPEASDTNHIYLMRSFNGGITFSSPYRVDYIADSISRFPTLTTDDSGNPVVAYMKFNSTFGDSRWVVTKSDTYGSTFLPDKKASGWSGIKAEVCDCCPGAIVSAGNKSAVLYRDNLSNLRDIWTGISNNNNATFNSGFAADNNNWMLMSCPASGPDGVIINDSLYTVFMSGASGKSRTYISKSSLSSGSYNAVLPLTTNFAGLAQQNFPRIASSGYAAAIVWLQAANGMAQLPVLFTDNIANGFPAMSDTVDLNDITNADVALSNGNIYVVWEDDNSGTVKFRSGTYKSISTNISPIDEVPAISVFPNPVIDLVNIHGSGNQPYTINVFNVMGEKLIVSEGLGNQSFSTTSLPKGIYFLSVITANKTFSQTLIKE